MNVRFIACWLLLIVATLSFNGCSVVHISKAALFREARKSVREVAEFFKLYPHALTEVSYLANPNYQPILHAKVGQYGRYVLELEQQVQLNAQRTAVTHWGKTTIRLLEIRSIKIVHGQAAITYGDLQYTLNQKDWRKLVRKHGRLKAFDHRVNASSPIPMFNHYLNAM